MSIISELITNMGHSTEEGFYGVSAIYIYMAIILCAAFFRIHKMSKQDH